MAQTLPGPVSWGRVMRVRKPWSRVVLLSSAPILALASCSGSGLQMNGQPGTFVISAGPAGEEHFAWGSSLAAQLEATSDPASLSVLASSGSVSNLRRLTIGAADLAIATADTLSLTPDACSEKVSAGSIDQNRVPLRALGRIYDDYLQILVRAQSPIRSVDDLAGRSVAVGQTGSGSSLMACRVLTTAGVEVQNRPLGLDDGLKALRTGSVDAVFWSGGLPTRTIVEALHTSSLRLVPLDSLARELQERYNADYRPAAVPVGVYGSSVQVATLASPNILVSRQDAEPDLVTAVLETVFTRQDEMAQEVPAAVATDRRSAILTGTMQLHDAAIAYYRRTHA